MNAISTAPNVTVSATVPSRAQRCVVRVDASTDGTVATVELDVTGPRKPEPAWRLAELLSERRGERVTVELSYTLTQEDRAVSSG